MSTAKIFQNGNAQILLLPKDLRFPEGPEREEYDRQPGGWEGQVRISEDFDAPLPPEVQDAFDGGLLKK